MECIRNVTVAAAVAVAAGVLTAPALANTISFGESSGTGYTATPFDDTYLETNSAGTNDSNVNFGGANNVINRSGIAYGLLALANLFSLLPATSGGQHIQINSATLDLASVFTYSATLNVYRVTTDWLTGGVGAGAYENQVTYNESNTTTKATWADGGSFSSADYTTTDGASVVWSDSSYGAPNSIDVTAIAQDMYSLGVNYGFAFISSSSAQSIEFGSSEHTGGNGVYEPKLVIDYSYVSVPEPAALGILTAPALLFLLRRRNGGAPAHPTA